MKITILSHNISSNAVMRAHRLAVAARTFAEATLLGPVEPTGPWPALPSEPWIKTVEEKRFPRFFLSFNELVASTDGDALIAVKPHLASFGAALVAAELKQVPVILDLDDLDIALSPRSEWIRKPSMNDLRRPASSVYLSLLTKAAPAASAITVASTALQRRFGGTRIPHGCLTDLFNPVAIDREEVRRAFGMIAPTVLFAGTPREHKGLKVLTEAVNSIPGASLAVLCRPQDLKESYWQQPHLLRIPMMPYQLLHKVLAAADVIAVPQLDSEAARHQMPMKVYDCMAMARPIVASAVSDLPNALEGCGRIVPPGDSAQLAAAISNLLDNPAEAQALGQKARSRCLERYSIARIGKSLQSVILPLMANSGCEMPTTTLNERPD